MERELKRQVAAWRRAMEQRTTFTTAHLDELESHLFDEAERLVEDGKSAREAVLGASARLGHADVLAGEYRKVGDGGAAGGSSHPPSSRLARHPLFFNLQWSLVMFRNYITVAIRSLRRQAGFSAITIGGLGVGLACAFLIMLFVRHELSYDRFHENADDLYRMYFRTVSGENAGGTSTNFAAGMAGILEGRVSGVEGLYLYEESQPVYLEVGGESRRVGKAGFMDQAAFNAFTFPLVEGDARQALVSPSSIVLTGNAARTLFGDRSPVGELVRYGERELTVTGVLADIPGNSHLDFDALIPFDVMANRMGDDARTNFSNWNYSLYVRLAPGVAPASLHDALQQVLVEQFAGEDGTVSSELLLQPITSIHLASDIQADTNQTTDPRTVWMFAAIGLLILFIAGVNFTNMATARAMQRAREVGVRKTVGAVRGQLTSQFLLESGVSGVMAAVLGVVLAILTLPVFSQLLGVEMGLDGGLLSMAGLLGAMLAIGLLTGLVAGVYPAFFLSAFLPSRVLKGEMATGGGSAFLRKSLIVAQFAIAIALVIATVSVYNQLQYMKTQALGFDREQVVYAPVNAEIREGFDRLRTEVLQSARIEAATLAGNVPGRVGTSRGYNWPGQTGDGEEGRSFTTVLADYDYIRTFGLDLIAGRDFSRDRPNDFENAYILNESAARELGFEDPAAAVGQPFRAWDKEMGEVIGVVRDFHFQSLHEAIHPVVINIKPWISWAAFRVAPGDAQEAVDVLNAAWAGVSPGYPFDFRFLDEDFNRLYETEQNLGDLFTFFALLAIFVSCLGLFGLSAFSARKRAKEIGVRKVLGASVTDIVVMLSREFTILVVVAFAIAAPIAWYMMDAYLADFAYRTSVSVWLVAGAGLGALLIALLTVGYQGVRASTVNPVVALKTE